jgi:hypothetical protein
MYVYVKRPQAHRAMDFSKLYIDIRRHLGLVPKHVVARLLHLLSGESLGQAVSHIVEGVYLVHRKHSVLHKLEQLEDADVNVLASLSKKGLLVTSSASSCRCMLHCPQRLSWVESVLCQSPPRVCA